MRATLLTLILTGYLGICNAQIFRTESISPSSLSQSEARAYERIQTSKGIARIKLISIQSKTLVDGSVKMELFDGNSTQYEIVKQTKEPLWKGKGKNSDRLSLRKFRDHYAGYVIHNGKRYVISPIGSNLSALYEQEPDLQCATERGRSHK
jgi:hypothetical protein